MPTWAPSTTTGTDEISTSTRVPSFRARRAIARIHSPASVCRMLARTSSRTSGVATRSSMGRPRASAGVYPKSRSAPGFQPTTVPPRSMVTIATGLVSTSASEYCFWRWISRKSPALWMASTDWAAKRLEGGDDLGREGAPLAPQDHEATEQPLLPNERDREERAHAFPGQDRPHLGGDELPLGLDVGDLDGLPDHAGPTHRPLAEPDRRRPQHLEVLRRDLMRGPRVEDLRGLVELVDDPAVAAGELDRAADDGLEHGLEVERGADGLADLAERPELADRSRQVLRPRLQLL